MKTVEIMLVVIVTTIVILYIVPKQSAIDTDTRKEHLIYLEDNPEFREFISGNIGCYGSSDSEISSLVETYLPTGHDYILCSGSSISELPVKSRIYVDNLFFSGNISNIDYKIVRLFYWPEE